jgi:hypothetical protein
MLRVTRPRHCLSWGGGPYSARSGDAAIAVAAIAVAAGAVAAGAVAAGAAGQGGGGTDEAFLLKNSGWASRPSTCMSRGPSGTPASRGFQCRKVNPRR